MHLEGIVAFPVVVADGDGGLHRLPKEVDHLPSSDYLPKFLLAGWRWQAKGGGGGLRKFGT